MSRHFPPCWRPSCACARALRDLPDGGDAMERKCFAGNEQERAWGSDLFSRRSKRRHRCTKLISLPLLLLPGALLPLRTVDTRFPGSQHRLIPPCSQGGGTPWSTGCLWRKVGEYYSRDSLLFCFYSSKTAIGRHALLYVLERLHQYWLGSLSFIAVEVVNLLAWSWWSWEETSKFCIFSLWKKTDSHVQAWRKNGSYNGLSNLTVCYRENADFWTVVVQWTTDIVRAAFWFWFSPLISFCSYNRRSVLLSNLGLDSLISSILYTVPYMYRYTGECPPSLLQYLCSRPNCWTNP